MIPNVLDRAVTIAVMFILVLDVQDGAMALHNAPKYPPGLHNQDVANGRSRTNKTFASVGPKPSSEPISKVIRGIFNSGSRTSDNGGDRNRLFEDLDTKNDRISTHKRVDSNVRNPPILAASDLVEYFIPSKQHRTKRSLQSEAKNGSSHSDLQSLFENTANIVESDDALNMTNSLTSSSTESFLDSTLSAEQEGTSFENGSDNLTSNGTTTSTPKVVQIWDKGSLTYGQFVKYLYIMRIVFVNVACLSMVCGCLTTMVVWKQNILPGIKIILIGFNVAETLKVAGFIMHRIFRIVFAQSIIGWDSHYAIFFTYFVTWFPDGMGRVGVLTSLVSILDRCLITWFPLRYRNRSAVVVHPRTILASIYASMMAFNFCGFISFEIYARPNLDPSATFRPDQILSRVSKATPTGFAIYKMINVILEILFRYIPLILILILTGLTLVAILFHRRRMHGSVKSRDNSPSSRSFRQLNLMILTTTVSFFLLVSIKPIVRIVELNHPTVGNGKREMYLYTLINDSSVFVDCCVPMANFLLYLYLNQGFRSVLLSLCGCGRAKTREDLSDNTKGTTVQ